MNRPDKAFILAAGLGTRMRPLTNKVPKPMVRIQDKPLLEHICEKLKAVGVTDVVINTHHLPHVIENWARDITDIKLTLSHEDPVLDTGGGVKNALHHFDDRPFYVIAGDSFWVDHDTLILEDLAARWHDDMDILMGLKRIDDMYLTKGVGDYLIGADTFARRAHDKKGTHMFTNIRINHPRVYKDTPDGAFSFLTCMDRAEQDGTLYGLDYQGAWHHISTPDDLKRVNKACGS